MKDLFGHDKVQIAIERLRTFEPPEGYYGAFSGGKDSCVIKELARMAEVKIDWHYNVTTIDPPELIYFIRKYHPETVFDRPEKPFLKRLVENGFPMFDKRWCCEEYKERGGQGRLIVTGIRWEESKKRSKRSMTERCFKDGSRTFLHPIIDWTKKDVWQFIGERKIPVCELYSQGWNRIGCIMCPNNYRRKMEADRWPRMKRNFIKAFEELYNDRKSRGLKSVDKWSSGKEMFDWWLRNAHKTGNPDQAVMFE